MDKTNWNDTEIRDDEDVLNEPKLNMKHTNWSAVLITMIATFIVAVVITYATIAHTVGGRTHLDDDALGTFFDVFDEMRDSHYFHVSEEALVQGAIQGMISATGDAYSNFFSIAEFEQAMGHLQGSFYGIGAEVTTINGQAVIVTPFDGSPAESYGILPGDVVVEVDGVDVAFESLNQIISRIRGEYGTVVSLGLMRNWQRIDIDVTRGEITNVTVRSNTFESDAGLIGYIQITSFGAETYEHFRNAIAELEALEITGLVIDLRNNAGGYLTAVTQMVSYLLPSGHTITTSVDRSGQTYDFQTTGSTQARLDVDIVTLINGGSASASEIFAAAMVEIGGFETIGTTSFGKGSVQQSRPIGSDFMLQLTVQSWLTPNGNQIEGFGVTPTIHVEAPEFYHYLQVTLHLGEVLSYDVVHPMVMNAQLILNVLGFNVGRTDGYFDQSTVEAIRAFQASSHLDATGDIDHATASALSLALRNLRTNPDYDAQLRAAVDWFN